MNTRGSKDVARSIRGCSATIIIRKNSSTRRTSSCGIFSSQVVMVLESDAVSHSLGSVLLFICPYGTKTIPCTNFFGSSDVLEFFMFSVRRALWCQGYVNKGQRITCKRDEVLLLRLVIDSIILVDLVTDPQSTFAWKLKAKCTQMHQEKFSWLLDPATIDMTLGHRAPSIWSRVTPSGYWAQVEWLMRQSMRPCAALMDQSVSVEYEVRRASSLPKANLLQQPEFFLRCRLPHRDLLPKFVVCNDYQWWNPDQNRNICVCNCACQSGSRNV